jgi:hypothetical protein
MTSANMMTKIPAAVAPTMEVERVRSNALRIRGRSCCILANVENSTRAVPVPIAWLIVCMSVRGRE